MGTNALRVSQCFTGVSKDTYRLVEPASSWHKHTWVAQSNTNRRVLFKSPLRHDADAQARARRQLNNEINILSGPLDGAEHVRQLIDTVSLRNETAAEEVRAGVFEYLDNDLHNFHLTENKRFSLDQIKVCARHLLTFLSKVHEKAIIHTDLKMENVAFSTGKTKTRFWQTSTEEQLLFKIIDFGVAASLPEDRHRTITNPYWRSPESWLGLSWGAPADIWSFGAIIGSLLMEPGAKLLQFAGDPGEGVPAEERDLESIRTLWTLVPFPPSLIAQVSSSWPELHEEIVNFKPRVMPYNGQPITLQLTGEMFNVDKEGWDFVNAVMQPDPDKRPTAEQRLRHPWLN